MPQAKTELHIILVREDCGQQAAEAAAGVVQKLAGELNAVTMDDILFIAEDQTVVARPLRSLSLRYQVMPPLRSLARLRLRAEPLRRILIL